MRKGKVKRKKNMTKQKPMKYEIHYWEQQMFGQSIFFHNLNCFTTHWTEQKIKKKSF